MTWCVPLCVNMDAKKERGISRPQREGVGRVDQACVLSLTLGLFLRERFSQS